MKLLQFEGMSDDTFGETNVFMDDYDNCASGKPIKWRVKANDGSLIVIGKYALYGTGGWLIGVAPDDYADDEVHIPDWPIRITRSMAEYSPMLHIEAPDDVSIECLELMED
jgi:hypothetical protein